MLPVEDLSATDEGLFATADYLAKGAADVDILVEELIKTAREITANPAVAVEFRNKYKLLPDLGAEADAEIAAYYEETAKAGSLPLNGGGADAAADDFGFFTLAGQIEGDAGDAEGRGLLGRRRRSTARSPSSARSSGPRRWHSRRSEGEAVLAGRLSARRRSGRLLEKPAVLRLLSVVLFAAIWEIAGRVPVSFAFPTFSDTLVAFVGLIADGSLPKAYLSTLQPLVLGVVLSAFLGVGVGTLCGLWRTGEWLLIPVFIVLQAAPVAAFIPLVTFVYGIGMTAKTLAVMILALPVIVLNTYKAVRNVNASLLLMCRSFLGTPRQEIVKIILPDASPVIFAGLRLGVAAGFVGVVLAELLITPTGIGDLITFHRSRADYAEMYATIASIIALSTLTLVGAAMDRDACLQAREERQVMMAWLPPARNPSPCPRSMRSSRCAASTRATATSRRCAASTSISRAAS